MRVERAADQDFIIIACDGIWETKTSQDVVDYIYAEKKKGLSGD